MTTPNQQRRDSEKDAVLKAAQQDAARKAAKQKETPKPGSETVAPAVPPTPEAPPASSAGQAVPVPATDPVKTPVPPKPERVEEPSEPEPVPQSVPTPTPEPEPEIPQEPVVPEDTDEDEDENGEPTDTGEEQPTALNKDIADGPPPPDKEIYREAFQKAAEAMGNGAPPEVSDEEKQEAAKLEKRYGRGYIKVKSRETGNMNVFTALAWSQMDEADQKKWLEVGGPTPPEVAALKS